MEKVWAYSPGDVCARNRIEAEMKRAPAGMNRVPARMNLTPVGMYRAGRNTHESLKMVIIENAGDIVFHY